MSAANINMLKLLFIGGTLREMRHRSRCRRKGKIVASVLRASSSAWRPSAKRASFSAWRKVAAGTAAGVLHAFVFLRSAQTARGGVRD